MPVYIFCYFSTFVCPTEIIAFSDRAEEFRAINCEVVACSVDSHFSHLAWYAISLQHVNHILSKCVSFYDNKTCMNITGRGGLGWCTHIFFVKNVKNFFFQSKEMTFLLF